MRTSCDWFEALSSFVDGGASVVLGLCNRMQTKIACMVAAMYSSAMPPNSTFVQNLDRLKTQKGCTWSEVSQAIGHKNERYLHTLRQGKYEPRQATVRLLAVFFDVPEAYFLEEHP